MVRVTLNGFDTHAGQAATQARLLGELADGLVALRGGAAASSAAGTTRSSLTYAEFGRRPQENLSGGTDHGTASVHFALGGRVAGGLYGDAPDLARLAGDGNPRYAIDFRSVYATVLDAGGASTRASARRALPPLPFLAPERVRGPRRQAIRALEHLRASPRDGACMRASHAAMNRCQCGASTRRGARAPARSRCAYSPASSSPRISRKRWNTR